MSDLISRQDAIDALTERSQELIGIAGDLGGACKGAASLIKSLPSAEPKAGRWTKYDSIYRTAICSQCEKVTMFETWGGKVRPYDFCPNCGSYNGGDDK